MSKNKHIFMTIPIWSVFVLLNIMQPPNLLAEVKQSFYINNLEESEFLEKYRVLTNLLISPSNEGKNRNPESYLTHFLKRFPDHKFKITKTFKKDEVFVYHFNQFYKATRVFGGKIILRVPDSEENVTLTGYFFKDLKLPIKPAIKMDSLKNTINKILNKQGIFKDPELGILPGEKNSYLCYKVQVEEGLSNSYIFYIDALTGGVLKAFNQISSSTNEKKT